MSKASSKGIVAIVVMMMALFFIFMVFSTYTIISLKKSSDSTSSSLFSNSTAEIAVVKVEGVIMASEEVIKRLHQAEDNKSIKAILMRIDSPGGAVAPTQEIYEEMRRIDKNVKPIYASFGNVAASGGYYLGAGARRIYASPGTVTGSIGVIMQFADLSKLYEFAKVKKETIKAGKYKDIGSDTRSMTKEEKALMNDMITGVHKQFMDHIMLTRKDKVKGKIEDLAQGQIFSGQDALELGLVDEMAGLWEAGRKIHKEMSLKGEFDLLFIDKAKKSKFMNLIEGAEGLLNRLQGIGSSNMGLFFI